MQLSKVLFWDVDYARIDYEQHAAFVIERVAALGKVSDWRAIQDYYGRDRLKSVLLNARYLDKVTLSFVSCVFDIPKEQFRCYTHKQLSPPHWDY